jgi:hypothetical protein
MGGAGWRWR